MTYSPLMPYLNIFEKLMKRITLVLIVIALSSTLFAQQSTVDGVFEKYGGAHGYTSIHLSEHMFNLFSQLDNCAEFDMAGFSEMNILVKESEEYSDEFFMEVNNILMNSDFKEVFAYKSPEGQYSAYVLESDGVINELLFFTGGNTNLLLLVKGNNLCLASLTKISALMNLKELKVLEQMN